ncbi:porin [Anaeromyxobacter sp. Fw109-5]|uniref:porin n=1 Tax=Anaeromyxobacter sp. (strain Fw109-5) TaxID=404589 RepID=UPI000158A89D|nr:porin [Anaeromyxobacter sp. Fw109-5]ABS28589.1 phosphate-selective porin O and P [Anaeromyxobacter sp. Fw109-5]
MTLRPSIAVLAALLAAAPAAAQDRPTVAVPQDPPAPSVVQAPTGAAAAQDRHLPTFYGVLNVQASRLDAPAAGANTSTVELRRARFGVRGEVTSHVGYSLLFEAADVAVKDAYVALKKLPWLPGVELRAGQWKTPFGYEQPESDTKLLWVTSSYVVASLARSTTTSSLTASGDARDLGLGVNGKWRVAGGVGAELAATVANGAGPSRRDDLDQKNLWARSGLSLELGRTTARAGGSYGYGRQLAGLGANGRFDGQDSVDDTSFRFTTYGGDVTLDTPFFFAAAELIQSERDVFDAATGARSDVLARGWYAGLYGKTPWNVGPVLRAERFDRNRATAGDGNERYTVGAYVDVLPINARLIANFERDASQANVRTGDRAILFGQVIF